VATPEKKNAVLACVLHFISIEYHPLSPQTLFTFSVHINPPISSGFPIFATFSNPTIITQRSLPTQALTKNKKNTQGHHHASQNSSYRLEHRAGSAPLSSGATLGATEKGDLGSHR
jgi:hypothetical protein